MSWDFSTEPEFQAKLGWIDRFVREQIWPLETLISELGGNGLDLALAPLREEVRARGLWAAHLPPGLGGQGLGQLELGLINEILVQNWIADSAAQMQAARLMTLHAAWKMDREGVDADRTEISPIKFFGAQVLHDVVDRAIQAHGALGYSTDLPLEAMYRYARAARIYDGPDEVHRASVARRPLCGLTPPGDDVPSEHVPTRRAAARRQFADLLQAVTADD